LAIIISNAVPSSTMWAKYHIHITFPHFIKCA
jgi:hypothetical protein